MHRLTYSLVVCLIVSLAYSSTWAITGNDWNGLSDPYRKGFVHGVMDGWLEAAMLDPSNGMSGKSNTLLVTCFMPKGMTYAQVYAIIDKHLKDNPEIWNQPLQTIIFNKIASLCPRSVE